MDEGLDVTSVTVSVESGDQDIGEPILSFFTALELEVLKSFVASYTATKELSREDCIALDFTFGPIFQQCLEMIEEEQVEIREGQKSKRVLIQVYGKKQTFWIPPGNAICQCLAFKHGNKEYCKHILAAHLFLSLTPKEKYKPIRDEEMNKVYVDCLK